MTNKTPLKVISTGSAATAIAEFAAGDTIPIANGGTGAVDAATARANLGIGTTVSVNSDTHGASSKTPPVDNDEIPLVDSAAAYGLKKLTWSNLKATLKTYFDSLYLGISGTAANSLKLLNATWDSPLTIGSVVPNGIYALYLNVSSSLAGSITYTPSVSPIEIAALIAGDYKITIGSGSKIYWTDGTSEIARLTGAGDFTVGGVSSAPCFKVAAVVGATKWVTATGATTGNAGLSVSSGSLALNSPVVVAATLESPAIGSITPGTGTFTAAVANSFVPNLSTVPTNGIYLPAANKLGLAANTTLIAQATAKGLQTVSGASTAGDVATSRVQSWYNGTTLGISWVDASQAADARVVEWIYSGGTLYMRYINDAYNAAGVILSAVGTSAGLTSMTLCAAAGGHNTLTLTPVASQTKGLITTGGAATTNVALSATSGSVQINSLATGFVTNTAATYTVGVTDGTIRQTTAASTFTLPAAASFPGRIIKILTQFAGTVISASSNVVPLAGGAAGTAILAATAGKFAVLQSDGTDWQITEAN